ncbi:MAG TPA: hypothetical protein VHW01_00275 [Polyangiaceae bacterium]|jgi:hypothetical protein|nr:hypothetical protein [Polyangiaceae bacterium]
MKPLVPGDELPEFVSELAPNETLQDELSELLMQLSALEPAESDAAGLARGRARLLASVAEERFAPLFGKLTQFFDLNEAALRAVFARASRTASGKRGPCPGYRCFICRAAPR